LPGTVFTAVFNAQAGVYLEPSSPQPVPDLNGANEHVVDATHSLPANKVGFRNATAHNHGAKPEVVRFVVRRVRRWHSVLDAASASLAGLKYVYETRSGAITAYSTTGPYGVLGATGGTNCGNFDVAAVGINPGDTFRLLSAGVLLEEVPIAGVRNGTELLLGGGGLQHVAPVGLDFEIYLHMAPVPHQQSCEELLGAIIDSTVLTSTTGTVNTVNELVDTGVGDHTGLGVQAGDILLVDPAGIVKAALPQERGAGPLGDMGTVGRAGYVVGDPSALDDNRGYYRCQTPVAGNIPTNPGHTFAGTSGADKVFSTGTSAYATLPTVHGTNNEGQNDLRVTAGANGGGSYLGNLFSIEPFSYRVIRPTGLLSTTAVDLALHMRERMLTWVEMLGTYTAGTKAGGYYVWQRDEHCAQLGDPVDPQVGYGILSNAAIAALVGEVDVSPYMNNTAALSILGRRFWLQDGRLDTLTPPAGGAAYTTYAAGTGLPVQPGYIENTLTNVDDLRGLRYAWLDYRVNKVTGTKRLAERLAAALPGEEEKAERLVKLLAALAGR